MFHHDDECDFNAVWPEDCGCQRRSAQRARENADIRTAYRFTMLGARVPRESYPRPFVALPIRISLGERFGMTEDGGFVLPRP